jgi:Tol biopolymer transport system component
VSLSGETLARPSIANQGNLLACVRDATNSDIWRVEITGSKGRQNVSSKIIYSTRWDERAKYSPDSKKIAYSSNRSGSGQIWVCDSTGQNNEPLTNLGGWSPHWSPDGRMITYVGDFEGQTEIFTISVAGGLAFQITKDPADDSSPSYSRDGNWIYFTSNRSGLWQIWKILSQGGEAVQVTYNGGYTAYESTDGKWIYYTKFETKGIWKKSLPDGEETLVSNSNINIFGDNDWDLATNGIYYITTKEDVGFMIHMYDFITKDISEIAEIGMRFCRNLNVSYNQNWILYDQWEEESDIIFVENFR